MKGRKSLKKSKLMIMSVVEEVVGNDDLLIEILVHLPPKSIFKCRCVSKRWNEIIAHPTFLLSYCSRTRKQQLSGDGGRRLLAFIQNRSMHSMIVNILPVVQQEKQKIKPLPDCFGKVVHSSDGLLLCYDHRVYPNRTYHVVNPLTRKFIQLPSYTAPNLLCGIGLACKENTEELVPSFKVVGIVHKPNEVEKRSLDIQTYSYETRRWTTSTLMVNEVLQRWWFTRMVVYKGVFHWHTGQTNNSSIIVYNSNRVENCIHLIKLPQGWTRDAYLSVTRSSTDNLLWVARRDGRRRHGTGVLTFWKLPIDDYDSYKCATTIPEDRWVLMHTIDNTSLYNKMSLVLKSKKITIKEKDTGSNRVIKLQGLIPTNHVAAVLNLQQKMFLYDPESQRLELVQYRGCPDGETSIIGWVLLRESLCLSSNGPFGSSYDKITTDGCVCVDGLPICLCLKTRKLMYSALL